jgi:hypothetical protein
VSGTFVEKVRKRVHKLHTTRVMTMTKLHSPAVLVTLVAIAVSAGCRHQPDSNAAKADNVVTDPPPAGPMVEFGARVQQYLAVRAAADAKVPDLKETSDPAQVSEREKALGEAVRALRANAKQGDIFTPDAAAEMKRIVKEDFDRRPKTDQKAVLEEVPKRVPVKINETYPTSEALATVPPALLLKLPTLPEQLEYRFLDRDLILRDIKANVIVDFIPDAVPSTAG